MNTAPSLIAQKTGTLTVAGKPVARLGFGAMRLTGFGVWGEPLDRAECVAVVRRAVELGVQFIDTADSYGPHVSEEIIHEAIHPYRDDIVIATKAGLTRNGPDTVNTPDGPTHVDDAWLPLARPEYLRQQAHMSLRRLGLERIDLYQLHRIEQKVPLEDQIGELKNLQDQGLIADIGLSEVTVEQIEQARAIAPIVSVQNRFNITETASQDVLDYCTREGIAFIPWAPIGQGNIAETIPALPEVAAHHSATVSQIAIAWLLARADNMLPIPGTSKVAHLEENLAAADITLSAEEYASLTV